MPQPPLERGRATYRVHPGWQVRVRIRHADGSGEALVKGRLEVSSLAAPDSVLEFVLEDAEDLDEDPPA